MKSCQIQCDICISEGLKFSDDSVPVGENRIQIRHLYLDAGYIVMMTDAHLTQPQIVQHTLGMFNLGLSVGF